jgi:hypothetical protein
MKGIRVYYQPIVTIDLTPEQWAMYDIAGAARAAFDLNIMIEDIINQTPSKAEAIKLVGELLLQFSKYGVADTEGQSVATQIINTAYLNLDQ